MGGRVEQEIRREFSWILRTQFLKGASWHSWAMGFTVLTLLDAIRAFRRRAL